MSKILYISGSTQERNQGVNGYNEEKEMQAFADMVKHAIEDGGGDIVVFRNNGDMTLQVTVNDSNAKKADYHLALHSNAGGGHGTECYYWWDTKPEGKRWAQAIYDAVAPLTVASDRGCMPDNVLYASGLCETRDTNAWACLIEIMFHDNAEDVIDFYKKKAEIAVAIAEAIYKFFGMTYKIASTGKDFVQILREVSPWADLYLDDLKHMPHPEHNWHGLIEKLYYTIPK